VYEFIKKIVPPQVSVKVANVTRINGQLPKSLLKRTTCGLYNESCTIVIYDCKALASIVKLL